VPLLLGGPDAAALLRVIHQLGFCATVASDHLGVVSATKMCRSMIIEGLEAMVIESLTAARRYGVETDVLASLRETFPGIDWEKQAAHLFEQVIAHGRRRSEEMREAVLSVREAGLEPWIATGAAERQAWIADLADEGLFGKWRRDRIGHRTPDWRRQADRILDHLKTTNEPERVPSLLEVPEMPRTARAGLHDNSRQPPTIKQER
jgi:3-hydroxyisobutyrate dehydrogenase